MTDGGEGASGRKVSEATKDKIRGDNNPSKKEVNKLKIRKGLSGQLPNYEAIARGAVTRTGRKNPEHSEKMTGSGNPMFDKKGKDNPNFQKRKLPEHVAKTSGKNNGMCGKPRPDMTERFSKKCVGSDGTVYDSLTDAAEQCNTTVSTISGRIRRGTKGWRLAQ